MHLADEVLDHLFRDFDVRDHTVTQGAYRFDRVGRLAHHHLRIIAHGLDAFYSVQRLDSDNRRLVQNDALIGHVDESIRRAEIDRHVLRAELQKIREETHRSVYSVPIVRSALSEVEGTIR